MIIRTRLPGFGRDVDFIREHLPQLGDREGGDPPSELHLGGEPACVRQLPVDPPKHALLPHPQLGKPLGKFPGTHLGFYWHHRMDSVPCEGTTTTTRACALPLCASNANDSLQHCHRESVRDIILTSPG